MQEYYIVPGTFAFVGLLFIITGIKGIKNRKIEITQSGLNTPSTVYNGPEAIKVGYYAIIAGMAAILLAALIFKFF